MHFWLERKLNSKMDNTQHSNIAEEEMGQLHAMHLNENAIAAVRGRMLQGKGSDICVDCGEKIADARRLAVPACIRCLHCQTLLEHQ
jgi:phage/conjugal plasmid C-4 type zinc finger TraR family protein